MKYPGQVSQSSLLREVYPYMGFHDRYDSSAVRKRTLPHGPDLFLTGHTIQHPELTEHSPFIFAFLPYMPVTGCTRHGHAGPMVIFLSS